MEIEVAADVSAEEFDLVIVGAGIAGSIVAKHLADRHRRILVLEAGTGQSLTSDGYATNLDRYYAADAKVPNAPYVFNAAAPQPNVLDIQSNDGSENSKGYFIQDGKLPFRSDYVRQGGGTTLHWLGTCLRMVPQDFELWSDASRYATWPIRYADLQDHYARAEEEIGVSADVSDQRSLGEAMGIGDWFPPGYEYPMLRIPPSYLDEDLSLRLRGRTFDLRGEAYPIGVTSTPQGRNGAPNPRYHRVYEPVGAVGAPDMGQRCQGNSSCVPICPVQAKYNATKSLAAAAAKGAVRIVVQAVASEVRRNPDGSVREVAYKAYENPGSPVHTVCVARGRQFVLAANAVENAKLLLASCIGGPAVGWYLMDHPVMLTWGQADRVLGTFRGPASTSGIETMRSGAFRIAHSAFRVEFDNWGWNWAANAPWGTVADLAWTGGMAGKALRRELFRRVQGQLRFGFLMEVPPVPDNRVSIRAGELDSLGNPRPVITFDVPEYTKRGMQAARRLSRELFRAVDAQDCTDYGPDTRGTFELDREKYTYAGAGHCIGGHVMGDDRKRSVVDRNQRLWDCPNLWLAGAGNMPSEGTSNPTLTLAALTFRLCDALSKEMGA